MGCRRSSSAPFGGTFPPGEGIDPLNSSLTDKIVIEIKQRPRLRHANGDELYYFPGLKESFKLTERLNTRCSGVESLLSGQK